MSLFIWYIEFAKFLSWKITDKKIKLFQGCTSLYTRTLKNDVFLVTNTTSISKFCWEMCGRTFVMISFFRALGK